MAVGKYLSYLSLPDGICSLAGRASKGAGVSWTGKSLFVGTEIQDEAQQEEFA